MQINPGWFRQRFTPVQINVYDSISEMSGCVKYQLLTLNTSRVWLAPAKGSLCGFVLQIWRQTGKRQVPGALVPALNLISSLENKIRTCSITEPVGGCNNLNCHTPTDCYPLYVKPHKFRNLTCRPPLGLPTTSRSSLQPRLRERHSHS